MEQDRQLRIASVLSFLYVALFVGLQVYVPQLLGNAKPPAAPKQSSGPVWDRYVGDLLQFAHGHLDYFTHGALLTVLDYLLLIGTAFGVYLVLRPYRPTAATITLALGVLSVLAIAASQIVDAQLWTNYANQFWSATPAAERMSDIHSLTTAQTSVIHAFQDNTSKFQILDIFGSTGLALWLALIGVTLLRLEGMRSLNGWATLAAGLLAVSAVPTLPVWTLGAGIGLWRVSQTPYQPVLRQRAARPAVIDAEVVATEDTTQEADPTPRRERQVSTARRARQRAMVVRGGTRGRQRR